MVFDMDKSKEANVSSLEQLLMRRLDRAFEAIDIGQGELFDEVVEEMEMLFKLKPNIYKQLLKYKEDLTNNIGILAERAKQLAGSARNEIQRRAFYESEINSIEWDARKDYLDKMITVMGSNQMIPMETSEPATLEKAEEVEEQIDNLEKKEPKKPKEEKSEEGKPKLTFKPKKTDKEFEL